MTIQQIVNFIMLLYFLRERLSDSSKSNSKCIKYKAQEDDVLNF